MQENQRNVSAPVTMPAVIVDSYNVQLDIIQLGQHLAKSYCPHNRVFMTHSVSAKIIRNPFWGIFCCS